MSVPKVLNIGSGRFFFTDCLNVDVNEQWTPDLLLDLSEKDLFVNGAVTKPTERFGDVTLEEGSIDHIIAWHILEHIPDLIPMMTNLLYLLKEGGTLHIRVPYELSHGAWQDPTHVRAFNENSWLYYTDWFWYLNWKTHRFVVTDQRYVLSPYGEKLQLKKAKMEAMIRVPRAVSEIDITLQKIPLSQQEREFNFQKVRHLKSTDHPSRRQ